MFVGDKGADNADNHLTEWEKSLESIGKFDDILIDLRKYGFTIITSLIGIGTFFQLGLGIQNAILLTNMTLIVVLYWIDLYYRNALTGGLVRSIFLEMFRLEMALTYNISTVYAITKAEYYTILLYSGLFLTSSFLAVALNTATQDQPKFTDSVKFERTFNDPLTKNQTKIEYSKTTEILNDSNHKNNNNNTSSGDISMKRLNEFLSAFPGTIFKIVEKPLLFSIFVVEALFLFFMYLTSRQRRRLFGQTITLYEYCLSLKKIRDVTDLKNVFERITNKGLEDVLHRVTIEDLEKIFEHTTNMEIADNIQFVANRILRNANPDDSGLTDINEPIFGERRGRDWLYRSSMNIGPLENLNGLKYQKMRVGQLATVFVARKRGLLYQYSGKSVHFLWTLVSANGILVLDTVKTFQMWQRKETYRFETDNIENTNSVKVKLERRGIVKNDVEDIAKLYEFYKTTG